MSDFDWIAGLTESEQAKALREMLADAWDEGFAFAFAPTNETDNPYRGNPC